MEITKKFILDGLARFDLSNLPGRPFDNAFELLAAPPARKRLIMLGFNGSAVDAHISNANSIIKDYEEPDVSNVEK